MKKPDITKGKWGWQKFGDEYYLCGQYGMRPMVLATLDGKIAVRENGLLEELYPKHPDAKAISAVPNAVDDYKALLHAIRNNKTDNGAIILGDKLEQSIRQTAKKMGFKYE